MITLCELHLEENPLTCPPANLCGRGRVHIFKYLEIQAVKEDKKRGVLTDGEYRRRYCSNLLSTVHLYRILAVTARRAS